MLMRMGLRATAHADAGRAGRLETNHEGGAAIGYRTAVQELQRQRHRLRGHHVSDRDRIMKLRTGMRAGIRAHQDGELGQILLRDAIFVHVARGDQAVIGRDRRPQRHLVFGMADLCQSQDRGVAALSG